MAEQLITEFYYFLADPAAPVREPAYHVNTVDLTVSEDGRRLVDNPRQRNMEQAGADGLTLPAIFDLLNTESAARVTSLAAEIEALKAERDELRGRAELAASTLDQVRAQLQALLDEQAPAPEEPAPEEVEAAGDMPAE